MHVEEKPVDELKEFIQIPGVPESSLAKYQLEGWQVVEKVTNFCGNWYTLRKKIR